MSQKATIPGMTENYQVHPSCKKYTLRDNGFTETKSGKFQLIRSLNFGSDNKQDIQLKVVISPDLEKLKMYTTTTTLQSVDLFKKETFSKERENLETILYELCESQVLEKA